MEDGSIQNSQITASNFWTLTETASVKLDSSKARLNGPFAWHAAGTDPSDEWVRAELAPYLVELVKLRMQGSPYNTNFWISKGIILWSLDGQGFIRFVTDIDDPNSVIVSL